MWITVKPIYTSIMELGPKKTIHIMFFGPTSIIVVYMDPQEKLDCSVAGQLP